MTKRSADESATALGKKGGIARAAKLTPERRSEIARNAAVKRWKRPDMTIGEEYTCGLCHGVFQKTIADAEATAEMIARGLGPVGHDRIGIICDDCFVEFAAWYRREIGPLANDKETGNVCSPEDKIGP